MATSIFKTGRSSSFSKRSRKMSKLLTLGAGALAVVFCLFMFYYFNASDLVKQISLGTPFLYLTCFALAFSKISNRQLYQFIFAVFILTSFVLLFVAYNLAFNSEYMILMLAIYSVMLVALPTTKQLLIFFVASFLPLELALNMADNSVGFSVLISISFGAVFILSYMISKQKNLLSYQSNQNAKILKTLVNNTSDSIFLVDYYTGKVEDANENTKEIFGLNEVEDFVKMDFKKLFSNVNFIDSRIDKIGDKIKEEGFYQADAMFKRKDGTNFLGRLHLSKFEAVDREYYLLQIKNIAIRKL